MRYKKDTFLIKANEIYSGKYDYSQMNYVNQSTKIKIICPLHGEYYRTPTYHLQGGDCPVCAKLRSIEGCKKPMSEEGKAKRRATNLERYGATTFTGSDMAKELHKNNEGPWSAKARQKAAETCEARFGSKTWAESEDGRKSLQDMCAEDSVRQVMSERAKSDVARMNYKKTSMKNHGSLHWTQSEKGKEKLHEMFSTDEERFARSQRMLSDEVRKKIEETSIAKYGVPYYWQSDAGRERLKVLLSSEEVIEKTKRTNIERYGNESWQGSEDGRAKLASEEVRNKVESTSYERYGAKTWSESDIGKKILSSDDVQNRIIDTKRKNGTINDSQPERTAYQLLIDVFDKDDVVAQYRSERYPYKCDFYVKSLDLFIELNAYWMHGGHWFDVNNDNDLEVLQTWIANLKPSYERAVYVWSVNDIDKREAAREHNLNYVVFWDNDLHDFKAWIEDGCPIRKDWVI